MENNTTELKEELSATNEPKVKTCELLEEILPLLKDYFIGEFTCDKSGIIYRLLNGQKFKLTVDEII